MIKYYYDLMSQPCRALYIFLRKANIEFQKAPIALRKGEHKSEEYAKINPFQLVPVIEDNGFKLTESVAIFRYLMAKHGATIPEHWYPKDPKAQARVDEYMEWQHVNTRLSCAMFFQHTWLIPLMTQSPPIQKKVDTFQERMEVALDHFENVWLKDGKPYLAGDKIYFADILAICELQQPSIVDYDITKGRPLLAQWYNRVKGELQPEFDEASTAFDKVKKATKGMIPKSKM